VAEVLNLLKCFKIGDSVSRSQNKSSEILKLTFKHTEMFTLFFHYDLLNIRDYENYSEPHNILWEIQGSTLLFLVARRNHIAFLERQSEPHIICQTQGIT